jgi:ABC-type dipeptide/oligopeptide/nickel transport system permease component
VVHGNLGASIRLHDSVAHLIAQRYPYTLALTVAALAFGLILALRGSPLPSAAGARPTRPSPSSASSAFRCRTSRWVPC